MNAFRKKIGKSLLLKILSVYLPGMLVLIVVVLEVQSNVLTNNLLLLQKAKFEKLGNTIASASSGPMSNFNFSLLDEFAEQISKDRDVVDVVFSDLDGKKLNTKEKTENSADKNISADDSTAIKTYTFSIVSEGSKIGTLKIKTTNKSMDAFNSNLRFKISITFISGLILFIGLAWFASSKFIIIPLNVLLLSIEQFKKGNKDIKINVKSSDEIGAVSRALQEMINSIRESETKLELEREETKKKDEEALRKMKEKNDYLSRSTTNLLIHLEKFAKGDLTVYAKSEKEDDDIAKLFNGFNTAVENIKQMMHQVTNVVESTASASTQISSSTEEMAAGAAAQSSQTAEVASAVEEMTHTIMETTQNAGNAAEYANAAWQKAKNGVGKIGENKQGMESIVSSAKEVGVAISALVGKTDRIGEMAKAIDEIADQTNLLALNAAIEAARAGEQGRGFAVVADEVRKLAERTTSTTKEIAEILKAIEVDAKQADTSMKTANDVVNNGMQITEQVAEALNEILNATEKAQDEIKQLASASEEEYATAEEISNNVESINNVAQETSGGIQQVANATEDLNRLTENLYNLINQFKIENGESFQINNSRYAERKKNIKSPSNEIRG